MAGALDEGFGPIVTKTMPNGNRYSGQMVDGKKHGWGEMKWINGNYYKGYWIQNKLNGKGLYKQ